MDEEFLARFRERSAYEAGRDGPPDGFPKLPDLPLGRYTDAEFQALEDEYLFHRVWLYGVHDSELPKPGSYRLCDIAGAPILLVRGDDGQVRAFRNACRHRGAPVVRGDSGPARLLVCQFHSWSYDLRGQLVRVPDERDFVGLQVSERASHPCAASVGAAGTSSTSMRRRCRSISGSTPFPGLLPEVAAAPLRVIDDKSVSTRLQLEDPR